MEAESPSLTDAKTQITWEWSWGKPQALCCLREASVYFQPSFVGFFILLLYILVSFYRLMNPSDKTQASCYDLLYVYFIPIDFLLPPSSCSFQCTFFLISIYLFSFHDTFLSLSWHPPLLAVLAYIDCLFFFLLPFSIPR